MDSRLLIAMSTMADGSMSKAVGAMEKKANRTRFLATHGLTPDQTILVHLTYDSDDYCRYVTVGAEQAGDGITQEPSFITDALFTAEKNVVFMLPIADCIGAVIYDPVKQVIGLAHLGRHNLEQHGGTALINYMTTEFGVSPSTIQVWLSPAAGRGNYPLHSFDNRSLHEVALEQLMAASVNVENITVDTRDTTTNPGLFSHSEFLKGNRPSDGRQAVICMVKPSGE